MFSGKKRFNLGLQPEGFKETDTKIYVIPSSSSRCSNLPTANDKLPYWRGLKKLVDHLNGHLDALPYFELIFPDTLPSPKKSLSMSSSPQDGERETIAKRNKEHRTQSPGVSIKKARRILCKSTEGGGDGDGDDAVTCHEEIPSTSTASASAYFIHCLKGE